MNYFVLAGLIALGALSIKFFPYILEEKNVELSSKADSAHLAELEEEREKFRVAKEEGLKGWVNLTIIQFMRESKIEFEKLIKEMEGRNDKRYQDLISLFQEYKNDKHQRLNEMSQYKSAANMCLDAMREIKESLILAKK